MGNIAQIFEPNFVQLAGNVKSVRAVLHEPLKRKEVGIAPHPVYLSWFTSL